MTQNMPRSVTCFENVVMEILQEAEMRFFYLSTSISMPSETSINGKSETVHGLSYKLALYQIRFR